MTELTEWTQLIPFQTISWLVPGWLFVCFAISWLGGWHGLAAEYEDQGEFLGERFRHRSGTLNGWWGYENTLTFSVDAEGLRIQQMFFLRPGHPRLFIPWPELSVAHRKSFWSHATLFTFKRAPRVTLRITDGLAEDLLEGARGKYNVDLR